MERRGEEIGGGGEKGVGRKGEGGGEGAEKD